MEDGFTIFGAWQPRKLVPFWLPAMFSLGVVLGIDDPTERYPLLVFLLPLFLRSSAIVLGLFDQGSASKLNWPVNMFKFAVYIFGWTLILAIVSVAITVSLLSIELTTTVMKRAILLSSVGFIMAAWLWWSNYAKVVLPEWPWHDVRVWVQSSNRWDLVLRSFRMRQAAKAGNAWWRGFFSVAGLVVVIMTLSTLGVYQGAVVVIAELLGVTLVLPVLHLVIVAEGHRLCLAWIKVQSITVVEDS